MFPVLRFYGKEPYRIRPLATFLTMMRVHIITRSFSLVIKVREKFGVTHSPASLPTSFTNGLLKAKRIGLERYQVTSC